MSLQDEMAAAHTRDYAELEVMRGAREAILMLLGTDIGRMTTRTRLDLQKAADALWVDMQRVVSTWD